MSKFLSIKAILFFSFWQGVILSILIHIGVIGPVGELSKEEFGTMLQDILICIEMVPAGAVFAFTFGYRSFRVSRPEDALEDDKSVPMKILSNFAHMASPIVRLQLLLWKIPTVCSFYLCRTYCTKLVLLYPSPSAGHCKWVIFGTCLLRSSFRW
jgi:hypothetical protein